mgnify:CR=1 FL=1|tara:strand:+ start:112 stop:573 length:462 start_codon:yes stop_codon:yes gene_type:complete
MRYKKQPENKERRFEMNGGYFIDGVAYMDCKITGEPVKNVSVEATSVIGSRAFMARMDKMFPIENKPKRVRTGRPSGWHFMNEFVDKDGTVFHKGVEQPKLKGTRPITVVKPKKKAKRRTQEQILLARQKEKKAALRKEFKKQKDFLNHKLGD